MVRMPVLPQGLIAKRPTPVWATVPAFAKPPQIKSNETQAKHLAITSPIVLVVVFAGLLMLNTRRCVASAG